jgi:hypothetical protein
MRLKTRTIAGGLVIAGAVLGTFMSGLMPGFGSGSGVLVQVSSIDESAASSENPANNQQQKPASVEQPDASEAVTALPPSVLEVRVDNHDYLVPDGGPAGFRKIDLEDIVKLAQATTGNDDGIRVRIVRTRSARLAAWSALHDSLEKSGLPRDAIRMPKELIE